MSVTDLTANVGGIPRKTLTLFFLVDTSGSMKGDKIGTVNVAVRDVLPEIKEIAETQADAEIKIAVLRFSDGVEWLTPHGPEDVEHYYWEFLHADGLTAFGEACGALNAKLSKKEFMKGASSSFAPVFMLFTDGQPSDEWQGPLAELKQNPWFKLGIKAALAIGEDADKNVLEQFTGNSETVIEVRNKAKLRSMIRFLAVTSSKIASRGADAGASAAEEDKTKEFAKAVAEEFPQDDWGVDASEAAQDDFEDW